MQATMGAVTIGSMSDGGVRLWIGREMWSVRSELLQIKWRNVADVELFRNRFEVGEFSSGAHLWIEMRPVQLVRLRILWRNMTNATGVITK